MKKLRIESPDRVLDAGGVGFVWVNGVDPEDSIRSLAELARTSQERRLRDGAVLAVALHQADSASKALADMTVAGNEEELREKAAFWLANQRGHEGLVVIERLAREDSDARLRETLPFDLTLSKEPAALNVLIRMAHEDASAKVRRQAQFWMAGKGGREVSGDLRQAASDPDDTVRKSAVFALSRLPGGEAAAQLIAVADSSKDPSVRKQAVFWLGQSSDPKALDYLTKLLKQYGENGLHSELGAH